MVTEVLNNLKTITIDEIKSSYTNEIKKALEEMDIKPYQDYINAGLKSKYEVLIHELLKIIQNGK